MNKKILLCAISALVLSGCASIKLNPGADRVIVSPNKAPRGCKFLGQVEGSQGNIFTGVYTSNRNLEQGAQNDLRNRAVAKGGNYVQMITNRAASSGGGDQYGMSFSQTTSTVLGNVYRCPSSKIDE